MTVPRPPPTHYIPSPSLNETGSESRSMDVEAPRYIPSASRRLFTVTNLSYWSLQDVSETRSGNISNLKSFENSTNSILQ